MNTLVQNFTTRDDAIKMLPDHLQPVEIVDTIAAFTSSADLIEWTEEAYTCFFMSENFDILALEGKRDLMFKYRLLMDMLRRIERFERLTFRPVN